MNTLRAKIALLLVTSIVAVVALVTITMIYAFSAPEEDVVDLVAKQLILMERLAARDPEAESLVAQPASGELDADRTQMIRAAAARLGAPLDIAVTYSDDGRSQTASVRVGSRGWLVTGIVPPSDIQLLGWFALITIGVGGIAVLAANRMSKPLALLESAVESVGPDGILPLLPERGPAEVRATAIALNSLSTRLKRAMESRMRLVADAGHDFRTPLTRMRLRAEFVSDDEERALWLRDIKELEYIADSAIQLVREESTKAPPEVICLDDLVKSVTIELQEQNFDLSIFSLDEVYVRANRIALSRALRNLLINAATHGGRGTVSMTGGETVRITIADQGPGISTDHLKDVFEPFFRVDHARGQNVPGAGLGLTISREIIRRAGGDIRIANGAAGGLIQVVELPAVPVSHSP